MRFKPGWKMNLVVLPLLPLLVVLGFWQMDRADEKQGLLTKQEQLLQAEPVRISLANIANYQPLTLIGEYDADRHFLLDNVVYEGAVGFDVLTPFYDESGQIVIVNRGWVKANKLRDDLPSIETPAGRQIIAASAGRNLSKPFVLAEQHMNGEWPIVIQSIDLPKMSAVLDTKLGDYFTRANLGAAGGFAQHYSIVNVLPSKHTAYAVQWFAMALALGVLYLLYGFGKFSTTTKVH